jgi:hypothetical protein
MLARRSFPTLLALFPLLVTGCIKKMLINGQIEGTRQASVAFDGIGDWELAYKAAASGIVQFEGMHTLAPDNDDGLFLLTKAWTGYAFAFVEDELEDAEDAGDRALADYHRRRAVQAYDRAIATGLELLSHRAKGFEDARKSAEPLKTWLAKSFKSKDDAANLFWTGYAWVARTNLMKDDAQAVADLWIGVALIQKSVDIDPTYNHSSGRIAIAGYHARAAMAELDDAKKMFDELVTETKGETLMVKYQYATRYACSKADAALYTKLLNEVIEAGDPDPDQRLTNTIAKRRARRWLSEKRMFDSCSMEPQGASLSGSRTPSGPAAPASRS